MIEIFFEFDSIKFLEFSWNSTFHKKYANKPAGTLQWKSCIADTHPFWRFHERLVTITITQWRCVEIWPNEVCVDSSLRRIHFRWKFWWTKPRPTTLSQMIFHFGNYESISTLKPQLQQPTTTLELYHVPCDSCRCRHNIRCYTKNTKNRWKLSVSRWLSFQQDTSAVIKFCVASKNQIFPKEFSDKPWWHYCHAVALIETSTNRMF